MKPVDDMTAEELRIEIAKVKGLETWTAKGGEYVGRFEYAEEGEIFITTLSESGWTPRLPEWTTDIAAAWGLAEEMKAENFGVGFDDVDKKWCCSFNVYGAEHINDYDIYIADTAPLAICHAYLAWKSFQS